LTPHHDAYDVPQAAQRNGSWPNTGSLKEIEGKTQMTVEKNKAIARRFFEDAWNQNKTDELNEYISTDRIHHYGARAAKEGPDELRAAIKNWPTLDELASHDSIC